MAKVLKKRTLEKNWRKAVLKRWDNKCAYCGYTEELECHHIIYKSQSGVLKYDVRNGIVGCQKHHKPVYHTEPGRIWCIKQIGAEEYQYLSDMTMVNVKDFKAQHGLSTAGYFEFMNDRLKNYINGFE